MTVLHNYFPASALVRAISLNTAIGFQFGQLFLNGLLRDANLFGKSLCGIFGVGLEQQEDFLPTFLRFLPTFLRFLPTFLRYSGWRCPVGAGHDVQASKVMEMSLFSGHLRHFRPFLHEMSHNQGHLRHFGQSECVFSAPIVPKIGTSGANSAYFEAIVPEIGTLGALTIIFGIPYALRAA